METLDGKLTAMGFEEEVSELVVSYSAIHVAVVSIHVCYNVQYLISILLHQNDQYLYNLLLLEVSVVVGIELHQEPQ